ncbi:MAG TPA: N-(5'-phosphoribosyl)anthranilate isomerase, partial [Bacillus bacterium]|nr:N-(5'-phosphoribosyl)anthranilate isomerase [Bacillus sp. (in: firmicutes)]
DSVKKIVSEAGLTHIQLHGEENPDHYLEIGLPIIKSTAVKSKTDLDSLNAIKANYILLDSPPGKYQGGNGTSFDWNDAIGLAKPKPEIILAGGLNPSNVKVAIEKVDPFMVDVSSGVESEGEKDFDKILRFITNAKRTEGKECNE